MEQATDILGLLMRHWNTIASELLRTLTKDDVYLPVLLKVAQGVAHGNDWARGFMRGIELRQDSWQGLIAHEEYGGPLVPIMILAYEDHPDLRGTWDNGALIRAEPGTPSLSTLRARRK